MLDYKAYFAKPQQFPNEIKLSENALWLWQQRYFVHRWDSAQDKLIKETTVLEVAQRIARMITAAEAALYSEDVEWLHTLEYNIISDIMAKRFLFGSPVIFNACYGLPVDPKLSKIIYAPAMTLTHSDYTALYQARNKGQMLGSCFVTHVDDMTTSDGNINPKTGLPNWGIFDSLEQAAIITRHGGGVGLNFSALREKSAPISRGIPSEAFTQQGDGGAASGPVSFMSLWDTMGSVLVQGGKRRAALMGILDSDHPDIMEFINAKTEEGKLPYFNISVNVLDELMEKKDDPNAVITLRSRAGMPDKFINASELWNAIAEKAWQRGDPGIIFMEMANRDNILQSNPRYVINSCNPCNEKSLFSGGSCNLGSINLSEFTEEHTLYFFQQVARSMCYLDLTIDASVYPTQFITETSQKARPTGLGIMGLADCLIQKGIEYNSGEALEYVKDIMSILNVASLGTSIAIAQAKGAFPDSQHTLNTFAKSFDNPCQPQKHVSNNTPTCWTTAIAIQDTSGYREAPLDDTYAYVVRGVLRNSQRVSIAPTGSISMLFDTSAGIEPNFAWHWNRKVTRTDGTGVEDRVYWHPMIRDNVKESILKTGKHPDPLFVTAHDLTWREHIEVVRVASIYVDSAISKTINLPNDATVETVKEIYDYCYKNRIKGITVYRDGSRDNQPIKTIKTEEPCVRGTESVSPTNMRERPDVVMGFTAKESTPWTSLYVTLNLDDQGKPFEVFISQGKTGSELKAYTEALSRVISVALRSGTELKDIIETMKGISGQQIWCVTNKKPAPGQDPDIVVRSIPDAAAHILEYLIPTNARGTNTMNKELLTSSTDSMGNSCPECKSVMDIISGCAYCFACGYSPCK